MNTLSKDASIKLQNYMPSETKYCIAVGEKTQLIPTNEFDFWVDRNYKVYKTLDLEEAIEMAGKNCCYIEYIYPNGGLWNIRAEMLQDEEFKSETIIGCIEKILLYLHDNNLLGKQN